MYLTARGGGFDVIDTLQSTRVDYFKDCRGFIWGRRPPQGDAHIHERYCVVAQCFAPDAIFLQMWLISSLH